MTLVLSPHPNNRKLKHVESIEIYAEDSHVPDAVIHIDVFWDTENPLVHDLLNEGEEVRVKLVPIDESGKEIRIFK